MSQFETVTVDSRETWCDGGEGPLGHPRVFLHIAQETGKAVCPYCSRTFTLAEGAAAHGGH